MKKSDKIMNVLKILPIWMIKFLEKRVINIPMVNKSVNLETEEIISKLDVKLKPYNKLYKTYDTLPEVGIDKTIILEDIQSISKLEESKWKKGFVSGAVYHGNEEHIQFLNSVYSLQSQSNPLHSDLFPSASKFESEIVSMTIDMLNGDVSKGVCGTVTSGGTESILLAVKTYRDKAKDEKNITFPEMIVPVSAHAAFEKAAEYFNIKIIKTPLNIDSVADINLIKRNINSNTILIVGSAPCFPYGLIDPIEKISIIAMKKNIGFHVDACLGGFLLPWIEKAGFDVPRFDFRLPGVTSISADTHKYGYSAKGTSVILYRNASLRHYQYFTATEWPGGLYMSPTLTGSRPGALSAVCWATMISMGKEGYLESTKKILLVANKIIDGINSINELEIIGEPLWVISFRSKTVNIYKILDFMNENKWNLNGLHKPSCIHICITLRHTKVNVAEHFISDLKKAVEYVKLHPEEEGSMAPVYGMGANLPFRGVVKNLLKKYLDLYYKTDNK